MEFYVNEFVTINDFEFCNDKIIEVMKFGKPEPYREFVGLIEGEKVKGLVSLNDDNVYGLKYL